MKLLNLLLNVKFYRVFSLLYLHVNYQNFPWYVLKLNHYSATTITYFNVSKIWRDVAILRFSRDILGTLLAHIVRIFVNRMYLQYNAQYNNG